MKDMKHLNREAEKRNIKSDNEVFGLIIIGIAFLVCLVMSPIGFALGFFLTNEAKDRTKILKISVGLIVIGLLISFAYVVGMPIGTQIYKFFYNYYKLFTGKESLLRFIVGYIFNPYWIVFSGLALPAGMVTYYHFTTDSRADYVKRESRKRLKNGKEVKFLETEDISVKNIKKKIKDNIVPDKFKKEEPKIEGVIIGKHKSEDIIITDIEAAAHGMVVGTTGAGKTTTLLKFVESCAERAIPLFYVDGKGDRELAEKIRKLAKKNGRKFHHFDMRGEQSTITYNPLYFGNVDNIKEKLVDATSWESDHYKSAAERVLLLGANVITQIIHETKGMDEKELRNYFDLRAGQKIPRVKKDVLCMQDILTKSTLEKYISVVKDQDLRENWRGAFDKLNPEWYMGMEQRLALIAESSVGKLVKEEDNGIRLTQIMDEKAIILFSLNALESSSITIMLGRMIVKDVNTVISMKKNKDVCYAIYDEHGSYISEDIESQFAMARSSGLRVITSTQDISDYKKTKSGEILMHKVVGNTNFKIIMGQNEPQNAEYLAKTIGTHTVIDKSMSTDEQGNFKGLGLKNVEEFIVNPNEIKAFGTGEAVIIKKIPKQEIIKDVKINDIDFESEEFKMNDQVKNKVNTKNDKINLGKPESKNIPNKATNMRSKKPNWAKKNNKKE